MNLENDLTLFPSKIQVGSKHSMIEFGVNVPLVKIIRRINYNEALWRC
jgi:hypothetical protein